MFSMKYTVISLKMQAGNERFKWQSGHTCTPPLPEIHISILLIRRAILFATMSEKAPRTQQKRANRPNTSASAKSSPGPRRKRSTHDSRAAAPERKPSRSEALPPITRTIRSVFKNGSISPFLPGNLPESNAAPGFPDHLYSASPNHHKKGGIVSYAALCC